MQTNEQKVQTAFILSIIAAGVADTISLEALIVRQFGFLFSSNALVAFIVLPIFAGPIVLGSIALNMIRESSGVKGKYRVFYIISRVLSIVAIVESAIICTIGLVSATFALLF